MGGREFCRRSDPPQAEKLASELLFKPVKIRQNKMKAFRVIAENEREK